MVVRDASREVALRHDPPTARWPMGRSDTNFVKMLKLRDVELG